MVTTLAASPGIRVEDYRCAGCAGAGDERIEGFEVVIVRRGAFHVESARGRVLADAQRILLFHRGESFRVTHPAGCGDHCLILGFDETLLGDLFGRSPRLDERRPEAPFRTLDAACPPALHSAALAFAACLRETAGDSLVAAEGLAALLDLALAANAPPVPSTHRAHAEESELAEAVRVALAGHLGERRTLAQLAAPLATSPYRLARVFRRQTGASIHQYRIELRLRAALSRLLDGERDLTTLALDLGFADHAHFSNAFRRRFGVSPSRMRGRRSSAPLSALRPRHRPKGAA